MNFIKYDEEKLNKFKTKLKLAHRQYKMNSIQEETSNFNKSSASKRMNYFIKNVYAASK